MNDTDEVYRRPFFATMLLAIIAAGCALFLAGLQGLRPEDYWWHVATGEFAALWGAVPDEQIFNYTVPPEQLWVHTEWLGTVVLAMIHGVAGAELSLLVRNLLVALTVGLIAWTLGRRHAELPPIAAPTAVAAGVVVLFSGVDPAVLALLPAAFAIIAAFRLIDTPESFWWALAIPAATLVVINLHFATALTLVAVGLVVALELWRRRKDVEDTRRATVAAVIAASGLLCLFGFVYPPAYWASALVFAFQSPFSTSSLGVLAIAAIAIAGLPRHPQRQGAAMIVAAATAAALFAPSTIPLLGVAAALTVAPHFASLDADETTPVAPTKRHWAFALLVIAAAIALQPGTTTRTPVVTTIDAELRVDPPLAGVMSTDRPLRCAEELRRTGQYVRVFHDRDDAGFLLYHLLDPQTPHLPIFDDPRELTPPEERHRARRLAHDAQDLSLFEDFEIDAVVIRRDDYPSLVERLEADDDWYDLRPQDDGPYTCLIEISGSQ